jgi:hypothetical protein
MVNFLGSLGGILGGFFENKANKRAMRFEKKKAHFGLSQAIRNRRMTEYNARLGERMAEERAADAGTYDPSEPMNVGVQAVNRVKTQNQAAIEGARENESLAHSALSNLRHQIKANRQNYYTQQALNLLGMGLGAYSMIPNTPAPTLGAQVGAMPAATQFPSLGRIGL